MPSLKPSDRFTHSGTLYVVCDIHDGIVYAERVSDGRFKAFTLSQIEATP